MKLKGTRVLALAGLALAAACSAEIYPWDDDDEPHAADPIYVPVPAPVPPDVAQPSGATQCQSEAETPVYRMDGAYRCFKNEDFKWRTSCRTEQCQMANVFVHYMLKEELGDGVRVQVEAFDNEHFQGTPVSTVEIGRFRARSGEWAEAKLYLDPGEYFVRAYLTTEHDPRVPYQLDGMELLANTPVGVYGALSGAQALVIPMRVQGSKVEPVHVFLDQLFKKEGSEPETNAHLRLKLAVEAGAAVTEGRDVVIELRKDDDLAVSPAHTFSLSSDALRVAGREGKAEFVTPSLPEGSYVVLAYLDANGNEYYDAGELARLHMENGEARLVEMKKDRTVTLPLELSATPVPNAP